MIIRKRKVRCVRTGKIYGVLHVGVIGCAGDERYVVYEHMGTVFCREEQDFWCIWCKFEEV